MKYETRALVAEVRSEGRTLIGRPIIYGADSQLIAENGRVFIERFMPGSVSETLKSGQLRAIVEHDSGKLLGTQQAGTLRAREDATGPLIEVDSPDVSYARDLEVLMARGDIRGMSFGFLPIGPNGETWKRENGTLVREINKAALYEVSFVSNPAYLSTTAALRSLDAFLETEKGSGQTNIESIKAHPLLDAAQKQAARILI